MRQFKTIVGKIGTIEKEIKITLPRKYDCQLRKLRKYNKWKVMGKEICTTWKQRERSITCSDGEGGLKRFLGKT